MTISKELLDELLKGCERPEDLLGDAVTCHGIFPPPSIRVRPNLRTDNEANEIHGRTDHRHPWRARSRRKMRG
ncbi:MAG: hypothetical protein ACU0CJ_05565, partial [Sulfitobacter sp.]